VRRILLTLVAITFVAGLAYAQEKAQVTGGDELVKAKSMFAGTWVHPDADITKYDKLYLWNATFQFRDVDAPAGSGTTFGMMQSGTGAFPVPQESREKFKQVVTDTFVKELQRSKEFQVVQEVGPGTLLVRGGILDIISNVSKDILRRGNTHLTSVGEGTFVVELIDAETGVIQARLAERRKIQPPGASGIPTAANRATVWADVDQWARAVAQDFRKALEKAKKKAE